jgi:hypothetical protein
VSANVTQLSATDIVAIINAISAAIVAICTVYNQRYAQQHKASAADSAALASRVSDEVVSLSAKVDAAKDGK